MNAPAIPADALVSSMGATMPDVQGTLDERQVVIQRVGVKAVRHPVRWAGEAGEQGTVGNWTLDVRLPAHQKGTHMSRFVALLEEQSAMGALDLAGFADMLVRMAAKLEAEAGSIDVRFPYFIRKRAPVSGVESLMDYEVTLSGRYRDGAARVAVTVLVPVKSLCPCSKGISEYGAHNQRSHVTVHVDLEPGSTMQLEELIRLVEAQASCELWGLLKRPDEKYVTERAYDNPKFVEDLVRDVAVALKAEPRVGRFVVEAENFESIHNHSAWARIESTDC